MRRVVFLWKVRRPVEVLHKATFTVRINQRLLADEEPIEFVCNENQKFRQRIKID
jgi:hypothetical protein